MKKENMSKQEEMEQQDRIIRQTLNKVKHKILILSGKGGVGKSTVAANLSAALADAGYRVGLMDVDLHGPSIPRLLGLNEQRAEFSDGRILPVSYSPNLQVVSIENLLGEHDSAIIWRGPMKIGAIRQFIADVAWEALDFLIIDSPPGTGDEPLTIAQTIPGIRAIIVTTPQEISLADVRKSINFCHTVNLPVIGLIENMSGYICPECGHREDIFGSGGGERTAAETGLALLSKIPIDPRIVMTGDRGQPALSQENNEPANNAFRQTVNAVVAACNGESPDVGQPPVSKGGAEMEHEGDSKQVKIAVPSAKGLLANHFGHCEQFILFDVEESRIVSRKTLPPPPHEPGVLPQWLSEQGASVIIAGGMGSRARGFFSEYGIEVVTGAPVLAPEKIVLQYLAGTLESGQNICDH